MNEREQFGDLSIAPEKEDFSTFENETFSEDVLVELGKKVAQQVDIIATKNNLSAKQALEIVLDGLNMPDDNQTVRERVWNAQGEIEVLCKKVDDLAATTKQDIHRVTTHKRFSNTTINITYFVHGTTIDNEKGISSGWFDVELSELGRKQSIELKNKIKNKKFDVVFCSDLKRATDSAKLMFDDIIPIIHDARLRECNYGKYNGQPSSIVEPMQEKMITDRFPEGESYEDVKIRISDFLNFLKKNYEGKNIALIAHKAPQIALDVLLKGKTWEKAFTEDWRKTKAWKPGWDYELK
ncbi:MAG: histidine phosphatase family protein [Candidatus Moranbacteria bacterium]|nr:histidine phosphatase family protein [Candidatus Moranbacteria bacterium]